jgi:thioredoxin reductase (NADPH)
MQERVLANEKIEVLWTTEGHEILGSKEMGVESVRLFNNIRNEEYIFPTQGVFIAIGHKPNTELFKGALEMDAVGYLKTEGRTMKTNIPGVFACGDAQDSYYRQAVTAAGTGCMAAIDAERYLAEQLHEAQENTASNW